MKIPSQCWGTQTLAWNFRFFDIKHLKLPPVYIVLSPLLRSFRHSEQAEHCILAHGRPLERTARHTKYWISPMSIYFVISNRFSDFLIRTDHCRPVVIWVCSFSHPRFSGLTCSPSERRLVGFQADIHLCWYYTSNLFSLKAYNRETPAGS